MVRSDEMTKPINTKMIVTKEEINKANSINITDYLLSIGEPLKSEGNSFYRHAEHDSLVINSKKNYFSWNSRNVSGNAVTYLMNVHNLTFQHAVKQINNDLENTTIATYKAPKVSYPDTFKYDVNEISTTKNVFNYLVQERKIDADVIQAFINADLIKEDSRKNVVFKWKENGELIGASLQGTREIPIENRIHEDRAYFKKILPTTENATHNGFNFTRGYPDKLYFFEAPIDLVSYVSLNKNKLNNCRLISMDGLKEVTVLKQFVNTLQELQRNGREIESVTLCVDNDTAGKEFIKKMKQYDLHDSNGNIIPLNVDIPNLPEGKLKWDWNNQLKFEKNELLKKNIESTLSL